MQKIITNLWFDTQAEEAANFYTSLFNNSRITHIEHYGEAGPGPEGSVLTVTFELDGQKFIALNGGPALQFTPAISLFVNCEDQAEVDRLWNALTEGGSEQPCGWLVDKYGVSWQIVPTEFLEMMKDPDPERVSRVTQAMFQMKKLDLPTLQAAYNG